MGFPVVKKALSIRDSAVGTLAPKAVLGTGFVGIPPALCPAAAGVDIWADCSPAARFAAAEEAAGASAFCAPICAAALFTLLCAFAAACWAACATWAGAGFVEGSEGPIDGILTAALL